MNDYATSLDRSTPPKPGPLTKVSFPKFEEGILSNGLEVWTVSNHEQPIVSLSLYIRGGSALDPRHQQGLASSVAELLTKGTTRRSATEIAEAIDFVGGSLTASAGWDAITVNISVLSKYLDVAIDLLSDVIQNSTFPEEEIERMRLQRLAGIRQAKADAGFLADMVFSKLVFPGHPYGQQPIGTEQSISEMNRDKIAQFAKQYITPSNSFLTAAGDITPNEFRKHLEAATSSWSGPARETVLSYGEASLSARTQVGLINREGAVQSALRVGHIGIRRSDPDFIALSALNMLLGGYFNSRINLNLREVHGYTYGARSFFDTRMGAGPFAVSTEVRTEVTVRAVEEIVSEISRITQVAVQEDELRMAKDYMIGSFPLQIETPQQVAGRVATI
ncbi:MAG TPA: pitrilysin family protein, partial [Candidatus Kapabacteria bacterium]|nr:pitrilysin family protein [Candidatus Kapabacteria bacterium]